MSCPPFSAATLVHPARCCCFSAGCPPGTDDACHFTRIDSDSNRKNCPFRPCCHGRVISENRLDLRGASNSTTQGNFCQLAIVRRSKWHFSNSTSNRFRKQEYEQWWISFSGLQQTVLVVMELPRRIIRTISNNNQVQNYRR